MKKLWAILLLCALALGGCSARVETPPAGETGEASGIPLPARVEIDGVVSFTSCASCYAFGETAADGRHHILKYIDLVNEIQRPLCFKEGCAHDGPDCMAWRGPNEQFTDIFLSADGSMLVWLTRTGLVNASGEIIDGEYDALCVSELDGSNKRALVTLKSVSGYGAGSRRIWQTFYDGEAVYYTVYESDGDGTETRYFYKTGVATGETRELRRWDDNYGWMYFCAAPVGDCVIIQEDNILSEDVYSRYTAINIKDGSVSELDLSSFSQGGEPLSINTAERDGLCFLCDSRLAPAKLYRCNILNGERELVFEKPDGWEQWNYKYLGGRLAVGRRDPATPTGEQRYALDEATRELTPLTLTYFDVYGERPITVCAETEDSFLVISDLKPTTQASLGVGGSVNAAETYKAHYSMISKADFWSSVPNYREIPEVN